MRFWLGYTLTVISAFGVGWFARGLWGLRSIRQMNAEARQSLLAIRRLQMDLEQMAATRAVQPATPSSSVDPNTHRPSTT